MYFNLDIGPVRRLSPSFVAFVFHGLVKDGDPVIVISLPVEHQI